MLKNKTRLLSESQILVAAQQIMDDAVAMITTNNLAISRLENVFLQFDLHLLKIDKKIYDLNRDVTGSNREIVRSLVDCQDKIQKFRKRK